jgi:hypothetical protein
MSRSVFYVVPAGLRDRANLVCAALKRGPNTFGVAASPSGNPPATHYYGHDGSQDETLASIFGAMPDNNGTLPEIEGEWGEEFTFEDITYQLPNAGQARAACAAVQISVATNIVPSPHMQGILSGLSLKPVVEDE